MRNLATILSKALMCLILLASQGFLFSLSAQWPTQEKELNYENLSIAQILDSLSLEFNVNFSYNADLEIFQQKRDFHKKATLESALNCLLKESNVEASIMDQQVIIYSVIKPEKNKPIKEEKAVSLVISGLVVSESDNEPLSYASVSVVGSSISTVANNEGRFSLKIPSENMTDSLSIAFIGYESRSFLISEILQQDWTVKLKEYATKIDPVHIKLISANEILTEMLDKVRFNYLRKNAMYSAFYREITSNEVSSLSLSEALIDIAKAPYGSPFLNDQARVFRGRKEEDLKRTRKMDLKLEGGIYNSLRLDVIKEEAAFLTYEGMKSYDYSYRKVIPYEGRNLHVIDFKGKKYIEDISYQGTLYIDVLSKALVAATFEMSPEGLKYARTQLIRKTPKKTNIKPVAAHYIVLYKYLNGRYYLNYTRAELTVKAKSDRLFLNEKFNAVAELAITEIDTTNTTRFRWNDVTKSNEILNEHLNAYDESYWGNYNIISPGKQINEAMENFQKLRKKDEE